MRAIICDSKNIIWPIIRDNVAGLLARKSLEITSHSNIDQLPQIVRATDGPTILLIGEEFLDPNKLRWLDQLYSGALKYRPYVLWFFQERNFQIAHELIKHGVDEVIFPPWEPELLVLRLNAIVRLLEYQKSLQSKVSEARTETQPKPISLEIKELATGERPPQVSQEDAFTRLGSLIKASDLEAVVMEMIMSLGLADSEPLIEEPLKDKEFYNIVHFLIIPDKSLWLDLLLSTDQESALQLYEKFSGISASEATASDVLDALGEVLNIIQGTLKSRLRAGKYEVIAPVVPQVIPSPINLMLLKQNIFSRKVYVVDNIRLTFTLAAHDRPIKEKTLKSLGLGDVLAEPMRAIGNPDLILMNKGTLLIGKYYQKAIRIAEEAPALKLEIIEPSPLGTVLENTKVMDKASG